MYEGLEVISINFSLHAITFSLSPYQIGRSEDDAQICRFFCEEMDISFHRFNPKVSVEVGITETDNLKICDCIIRLGNG